MSGFGNDFNFSRMISARNESRSSAASFCRSEEHTSELQSQSNLVCRLLLEKKKELARLLAGVILIGLVGVSIGTVSGSLVSDPCAIFAARRPRFATVRARRPRTGGHNPASA